MCLAIPMKVLEVDASKSVGTVDVGGIRREVDLSLLENVRMGDYVVVHAGFAISVTNEAEAKKTLDLYQEIVKTTQELEKSK